MTIKSFCIDVIVDGGMVVDVIADPGTSALVHLQVLDRDNAATEGEGSLEDFDRYVDTLRAEVRTGDKEVLY